MSEPKQVKVDNWGIYFLQRLKHFFNRTDYCDLTLQFQDNAQLKVHRLVLSACTEYFELLERTCEMYEDCLVMPDDLQADVVVPIVNFMYTGQLEFRMEILERLHATSEIMNMPVLTKLLDSHRPKNKLGGQSYSKRQSKQQNVSIKLPTAEVAPAIPTTEAAPKRTFQKAFEKNTSNVTYRDKKYVQPVKSSTSMTATNGGLLYRPPSPIPLESIGKVKPQKFIAGDPRPTRYELPEELDKDNLFENSFCNISYTSQPLMVHPETTKQYAKRPRQDKVQASTSKKSRGTLDIVECKKITREQQELFFQESESSMISDETQMFRPTFVNVKTESSSDPNKLFDQLLDQNEEQAGKVTIENTKNNKAGANLDHAKIISEVLKKYPHLVKSNKNIKLKIFNNPTPSKAAAKKQKVSPQPITEKPQNIKNNDAISDFTYETDVLDSKQAARLIALGAENIDGPWICLICGTPGRALHFTSYFKFRRHLVEVHNEKPVLNICEYCGQRMSKRNHLLYHMYTRHGVEPPSTYHFPKCSQCNYVALTEALLVKHKLSHTENKNFRCNVCPASFNSSNQLLIHIQSTGHKYIADRKHSHQCIYCLRIFIRENNLYAHLKTHHKMDAVKDGIIDESDDESKEELKEIKHEQEQNDDDSHLEYHIQQKPDGNIQLIQKRAAEPKITTPSKQKILNSELTSESPKPPAPRPKVAKVVHNMQMEHDQDEIGTFNENEEIVVIDNNEYIMSGNRLILRKPTTEPSEEFILPEMIDEKSETSPQSTMEPSTSIDYTTILNSNDNIQQANIILKDTEDLSESIPIYVSNEEEYKALMSSNHNIIFDSGDSNKTLTVLTTPDAATLDNASINLDSTQNNDMMIIHEEYPLNVSQAVATDSSNIVVVYSQHVDDPTKGYQLLTTQALGPQYAQSSAILTQNYETVSTSSPVMSAHILDSQVATWQGDDIHQNIDDQHTGTSAVLQTIVHADEVPQEQDTQDSMEDMNDLPQVQLIPTSEPAHFDQNEPELMENSQNISMEIDAPLVDEKGEKIETFTSVEVMPENVENTKDFDEDEILKQSESQEIQLVPVSENVPISENIPKVANNPEVEIVAVQSPNTNENVISLNLGLNVESNTDENISLDVQNSDTNENIISMDRQSSDTNETLNIHETITEMNNVTSNEAVCTNNELCATDTVEHIEELTSEWTEENAETNSQDLVEETDLHTESRTNSEEIEESVENIQQELKNQMLQTKTLEDNVDSPDLPAAEKDESNASKTAPQVKISSLLNDWDDNDDSQEDNDMDESVSEPIEESAPSGIQNPDVIPESNKQLVTDDVSSETATMPNDDEVIENTPENTETLENNDQENIKSVNENEDKQDNIKSLVSDWDDDEEDKV